MPLSEIFPVIRQSLVAFTPSYLPAGAPPPVFPPIFGTGVIVREAGVIMTNAHVVDAFQRVFRPSEVPTSDWCVTVLLLHVHQGEQLEIPLEITGIGSIDTFDGGDPYYGPPRPDLAAVHVRARGLPVVTIDRSTEIYEGRAIATAGFPMGSDLLLAPGWLHQIGPTLQSGIVSAVLPCPGVTPHAFSINVMVQGGASGSPVFDPDTGALLGILNSSLNEQWAAQNGDACYNYMVPTNISYVVPSHYIGMFLDTLETSAAALAAPTLSEIVTSKTVVVRSRAELFPQET